MDFLNYFFTFAAENTMFAKTNHWGEQKTSDDGSFSDPQKNIVPLKGSFHSSELWYMFGTLNRCWRPMEKVDYELSDIMVSYWKNFALFKKAFKINL